MATRKLYIEFNENATTSCRLFYEIYIEGAVLRYPNVNDQAYVLLIYSSGFLIGTDIDDTINKALTILNSNYAFNGYVAGYQVSITYIKVGTSIEVSINSNAPIQVINFGVIESANKIISYKTETPCLSYYMSNLSVGDSIMNTIGALIGSYYLKDNTLGTGMNQSIYFPGEFTTELVRGNSYSIIRSDGSIVTTWQVYVSVLPSNINAYFSANDLYINIVGLTGFDPLNYSYSIDGTTYQSSNIFTGLATGNYTYYIKDSLGCIKSFTITNSGSVNTNTYTAYHYISDANSIRFALRQDTQNCGNYKTVYNTLSYEESTPIHNTFIQLFQSCDLRGTQILSSYDNLEIFAKDCEDNLTELTANKIVNNIQISDKRDCIYFTYNNQLAIIYLTGNKYDFGTTNVIGTYALNGLLPAYGIVGNWLETDYGTLQIVDIKVLDNGNRALILNQNVNITGQINGTVQVIYNRDSFNIWEFITDMSLFLNKKIQIGIRFYQDTPDVNFPDVYYLSEKILVKERHSKSLEFIWKNSKNTDVYFASGIEMKNRLNFAEINTQLSDGTVEVEKTDSQVISIDASNYNSVELEILYLSTGMIRKILLALKHDNLIIEKVPYKLTENPEISRIGKSNFYTLKAKLIEAGDVWNQGTANTNIMYSDVELVGLLQGNNDGEFIKIK